MGRIGSLGLAEANYLYIGWINNKVLLYSTGNYIQYPVTNHNGKEYMCVCVYVSMYVYITESLCCTAEINKTLQINYTSIIFFFFLKRPRDFPGSPVVKTLPSNAGGVGSIPGQGTKIPHAMGCGQKLKKGPHWS